MKLKKTHKLKLRSLERVYLLQWVHGLPSQSSEEAWARFHAREHLLGDWDWMELKIKGKMEASEYEVQTLLEFSTESLLSIVAVVDRIASGEKIPLPPLGAVSGVPFEQLIEVIPLAKRMQSVANKKSEDDSTEEEETEAPAIARSKKMKVVPKS